MAASKYHLTSSVITPSENGEYAYHTSDLLIPHEALRREMARCLNAVRNLTVREHPWKAYCFTRWFTEYFAPALHEHHHLEETILFSYYGKLGAEVPEKLSADHHTIVEELNSIVEKSRSMLQHVKANELDQASALAAEITSTFEHWNTITLEHLAEEERDWPPIFAKYGEKHCEKCTSMIVNEGVSKGGRVFEDFGCAVIHAMGHDFNGYPRADDEKGWAGPALQKHILHAFPLPVRMLLVPKWNKRFHKWKKMITSVAGTVDELHLQDKPERRASASCAIM